MELLNEPKATIPSNWYYDPQHYQRELEAIWYQQWVCVGRDEDLNRSGDYFTAKIGDQGIIVTRTDDGVRAYFNTCRHRGAQLCSGAAGRFSNGRIICPYHTWTYSLEGDLVATPHRLDTGNFDATNYSLYGVHVEMWRGFIFVNLAEQPKTSLLDQLGSEADMVANWPLEDMRSVHRTSKIIESNWKVYWENFSECYHCPRIHPALCHVMPVYKLGTFDSRTIPDWTDADDGDAETWTPDGKSTLPAIDGLSDEELGTVVTFAEFMGSMYISAHRDYLRSVRLMPRGPETVELIIDWFLPKEHADISEEDMRRIVDFPLQVVAEDGEMCELNQKGLKSVRHERGALVEQEYDIYRFHNWVNDQLENAAS